MSESPSPMPSPSSMSMSAPAVPTIGDQNTRWSLADLYAYMYTSLLRDPEHSAMIDMEYITPNPARLSRYLHHLFTDANISPQVVLLATRYLTRLPSNVLVYQPPCEPPSPASMLSAIYYPILLLTSVLLVADKFLHNPPVTSLAMYSRASGLSIQAIASTAVSVCAAVAWNLDISKEEWTEWVRGVARVMAIRRPPSSPKNVAAPDTPAPVADESPDCRQSWRTDLEMAARHFLIYGRSWARC
ncbi:hypothetical protein HDU85_007006 [Gaertneriomyces sp. JEL0708]|nr:hypothetical protein HDU85_007006 [Gaertneriomyces sp. JEL0708]